MLCRVGCQDAVYDCLIQGIYDKVLMAPDSSRGECVLLPGFPVYLSVTQLVIVVFLEMFRRQLAQPDVVAAEIVNNMGGVQLVALSCGHLKIW